MTAPTRRLLLSGERPQSWNGHYSGKHWAKRKEETDRVALLVRSVIDPNQTPVDGPVELTFTAYLKGKRIDASNLCFKPYEDALIGFWIHDDAPQYVPRVVLQSFKDNRNPRVEIEMRPIEPPPF